MVPSISERLERLAEEIVGKLETERARMADEEERKEAAELDAKLEPEPKEEPKEVPERPPTTDPQLKEELQKALGEAVSLKEQLEKATGELAGLTTTNGELSKATEELTKELDATNLKY